MALLVLSAAIVSIIFKIYNGGDDSESPLDGVLDEKDKNAPWYVKLQERMLELFSSEPALANEAKDLVETTKNQN